MATTTTKRGIGGTLLLGLLALLGYLVKESGLLPSDEMRSDGEVSTDVRGPAAGPTAGPNSKPIDTPPDTAGGDPIPELFDARRSDTMVTMTGRVVRLLADDNDGDRHQRFLVDTPGGITVKVSHNIDLSDRVPVRKGDTIKVRGEYEWNDLGGVVHWTHRDPKGWHEDGWIAHNGKYYGKE